MNLIFYKKEKEEQPLESLLRIGRSFFILENDKGAIPYIAENIFDGLPFELNGEKHNTKDYFIFRVVIHNCTNLYFLLNKDINQQELIDIVKEKLFSFNESDNKDDKASKEALVVDIFNVIKNYHPIIGFSTNNIPLINDELCKDMIFILSKQQVVEETKKEPIMENKNKKRDRSNLLWDIVFSLFVPLLLAAFLFIIIESLYKKNAGLAITFIFICYVEPIILIYDLYTTYKNRTYKPFSLEKFILYGTNLIGIALGGVVSYLLGKNLFKLESNGLIRSFILIASLIAIAVIILVHIIVLLLVKRSVKKLKNIESNKDSE